MTTTCSTPGKIYLFGEHAVVYRKRAIASAINLRTTATVSEKAQHDKLVSLVDNMLDLQKKSHETRMKQDKQQFPLGL